MGAARLHLIDTCAEYPVLVVALGRQTYPKAARPGKAGSVIRDSL
jgi:hypothetical protein